MMHNPSSYVQQVHEIRLRDAQRRLKNLKSKKKPHASKALGVVCCYFNPANYASKKKNLYTFYTHIKSFNVRVLIVELAYGNDAFELDIIPDADVKRVRASSVLFHKENLLNIGIKTLIDEGCTNIAWLDADILFISDDWVENICTTLEEYPICQVYETVFKKTSMHDSGTRLHGSVKEWVHGNKDTFLSTGYGWAARREILCDAGLYEFGVMGEGDVLIHAACFAQGPQAEATEQTLHSLHTSRFTKQMHQEYVRWRDDFAWKIHGRVGYVPQQIIALYHGSVKNRKYGETIAILQKHEFDPCHDLTKNEYGCLEWNTHKPALHEAVKQYFYERKEDDALFVKTTI